MAEILSSPNDIDEIYTKNMEMVYRICFMILKNSADAEDAVQAVFIKLIQSKPIFTDTEHQKAWLIVTAQNTCKNNIKSWWNRIKVSFDDTLEHQLQTEMHTQDTVEDVLRLPSKYKLPIYLHYYEGYSSKEIADMLNINESTLRSRLKVGREKLKLMIGGGQDE